MERRKFITKSGQALLAISTISITGAVISSCSPDDSNDFFNDGYYGDGYYGDGYYDDGYYEDGYYDDGYYDDGYYDDGYYDDGYYDDGYYDDGYYDDGYYDDGYYDDGYYGDAQVIRDILMDGLWYVQNYNDSGSDQTATYNGYEIDFMTGDQVSATNGSNTNNGTWIVNGSGTELALNFIGVPFDEFNDDWDIISVLPNRIELRDVSGGGSGTDILILEKL
ncbi:hypothetical protein ATE92_0732 [Ulvibacter sp. MAR_2010_11]|uniref:hypothetical protein n=1 Tax=Ulvibacter sp. MAR_2010_11 TaxID=1250229 RepID=UPI000CAD8D3A|nr:hypothetical protein [Ulvibacter sp. MAR_2010_11]PKA82599.1 hypothetical protein ATE92_0732 [Ulvibacter sp. MAR_2010_11]